LPLVVLLPLAVVLMVARFRPRSRSGGLAALRRGR
jgi:hypothetical protein